MRSGWKLGRSGRQPAFACRRGSRLQILPHKDWNAAAAVCSQRWSPGRPDPQWEKQAITHHNENQTNKYISRRRSSYRYNSRNESIEHLLRDISSLVCVFKGEVEHVMGDSIPLHLEGLLGRAAHPQRHGLS